MISLSDFEIWYAAEASMPFGIPCSEVVSERCACAGAEKDLLLIFLPGEAEFFSTKTGLKFPVQDHAFQGHLFQTATLPRGCASCVFGPACRVAMQRPLECRLFPVAPAFLGIGPYFDHCPYQRRVTPEFFSQARLIWDDVESKVGSEWLAFYRSFVRVRPTPKPLSSGH